MMTITSKKFDLINPPTLGLWMGGGIIIMRVYSFTTFDFILIKKTKKKTLMSLTMQSKLNLYNIFVKQILHKSE